MVNRILTPPCLFGVAAVALVAATLIPTQSVEAQQTFKAPPSPGQSGAASAPSVGGSSDAAGNNKPRTFAAPPTPGGGSAVSPPPPGGNPNTAKGMIALPPPGQAAIKGDDRNRKNKWKSNDELATGHGKKGKSKAGVAARDDKARRNKNGDVAVDAKLKHKRKNAANEDGKRKDSAGNPATNTDHEDVPTDSAAATQTFTAPPSPGSQVANPISLPASTGGGQGFAPPPTPGQTPSTDTPSTPLPDKFRQDIGRTIPPMGSINGQPIPLVAGTHTYDLGTWDQNVTVPVAGVPLPGGYLPIVTVTYNVQESTVDIFYGLNGPAGLSAGVTQTMTVEQFVQSDLAYPLDPTGRPIANWDDTEPPRSSDLPPIPSGTWNPPIPAPVEPPSTPVSTVPGQTHCVNDGDGTEICTLIN
jgi:hypothetical protein